MNFCSKHQFGGDTCFTCHIEKIDDLERKLAEETKARKYAELTRGEYRRSFQLGVEEITELEGKLARAVEIAMDLHLSYAPPSCKAAQAEYKELTAIEKSLNTKS